MPIQKNLKNLEISSQYIFLGIVRPIGVGSKEFVSQVRGYCFDIGYSIHHIKLSKFIDETLKNSKIGDDFRKIKNQIECGNALRRKGYNLVLSAIKEIQDEIRKNSSNKKVQKIIFVIDNLKHLDELILLRQIFENHFLLFGLLSERETRMQSLIRNKKCKEHEANELLEMDETDDNGHGQQTQDVFSKSDFFLNLDSRKWRESSKRFLDLVFTDKPISPDQGEICMNLAFMTARCSTHPSRQVGAVILSKTGEILSVGYNDEAKVGGGVQSSSVLFDSRTEKKISSYNVKKKEEKVSNILRTVKRNTTIKKMKLLKEGIKNEISTLIEFVDEVHGEQEAILSVARKGVSLLGSTIFATTYPCHICTNLIIAAGITKVIYVEPYEKSLSKEMFENKLSIRQRKKRKTDCVEISQYSGVGFRLFPYLFNPDNIYASKNLRKEDKIGAFRLSSIICNSFKNRLEKLLQKEVKVTKKKNSKTRISKKKIRKRNQASNFPPYVSVRS